jgi:hypothetical protein
MLSDIARVCRTTTTENLDTLKENSKELIELGEDFLVLVEVPRIEVISFYETQKTPIKLWGRMPGWRSIKVI